MAIAIRLLTASVWTWWSCAAATDMVRPSPLALVPMELLIFVDGPPVTGSSEMGATFGEACEPNMERSARTETAGEPRSDT
jgi:hypothetical protein